MDLFENEVDDSCSISNLTMNLFSIAYLAVAKKVKFYYTHVLLCCYVQATSSVENCILSRDEKAALKLFGYFLKRYKSSLRPYSLSKSFVLEP